MLFSGYAPPKKHLGLVFQDDDQFYLGDSLACEQFVAEEGFYIEGPSAASLEDDGSVALGSLYVWEPQLMFDQSNDFALVGNFTGYCVVTQLAPIGANCQFVIINFEGDQLTFTGHLQTPQVNTDLLGALSITGGTGSMAGAVGDFELTSLFVGDNLFDSNRFDVSALIGLIVCNTQPMPTVDNVYPGPY